MNIKFSLRLLSLLMGLWLVHSCLPEMMALAATPSSRPPRIIQNIGYPGAAKGERRLSLDIYLPAHSVKKPPLLIFVHGGFWLLTDDDHRIGPSLAENLVKEGVAVALLRYRLAPAHRHPAQVQDVAAGTAYLMRNAEKYGYDGKRIFLGGHSAGGHLASLVALDRRYLAHHGVAPSALAGVVSMSGLYDLQPQWNVSTNQKVATERTFGNDPSILKQASPVHQVRADAPPFLIMTAGEDLVGFPLDARRFAQALRAVGNQQVDQLMFMGMNHFTLTKLDEENLPARRALLGFMGVKPAPEPLAHWIEAKRVWAEPPHSTEPFWKHSQLVRSYAMDERFVAMLLFVQRGRAQELLEWPLRQFHAIDLFSYLDALPKSVAGEGAYIELRNLRGEKQVWQRDQIERYKPVIVIGIDDEKNLFRFSTPYRMQREYSWKPSEPTAPSVMTLGAFVYFLDEPPEELRAQSWHFGLTVDSFRRFRADPLAAIRNVAKDIEEALTFRNGCVYCHNFRGVGARSHHVDARTGKPQGGYALPLETYPPEVWKAFMFDQEAVAAKMGATPNLVKESARQELYELVNRSRDAQSAAPPK